MTRQLPVSTVPFWKQRIVDSRKYGDIHNSVYISTDSLWKNIEEAHKKILSKEIALSDKVLDAGCGYGRASQWFSPEKYLGLDISPDLLDIAKDKNKDHTFIVCDLGNLPFLKDKEMDVAFCISIKGMIINNLGQEAWDRIEKELRRVSKKLLILEYEVTETYETII